MTNRKRKANRQRRLRRAIERHLSSETVRCIFSGGMPGKLIAQRILWCGRESFYLKWVST
jgi:hypothetical protein